MNSIEEPRRTDFQAPPSRRGDGGPNDTTRRSDMYAEPHRTLRYMLSNLLVTLGRADFSDVAASRAALGELTTALWACDGHIEHEDRHVRPALAARAPSATEILDAEHAEHTQQIAELRAIARSLEEAGSADARAEVGRTLYLHFSVFFAETLAHLAYEERVVQPLVERLFTDGEIEAIHAAIIGSIAPPDMVVWLQSMIPSASRGRRRELLALAKASAPPHVLESLLDIVKPRLSADDWADLERSGRG